LEGYAAIVNRMREENVCLPMVAIGGITIADIPAIMQTGVSGIALSGTVLHADSPADEMRRIISLIKNEEAGEKVKNEKLI
jgi:thiamine-phosphate pyrophosphorylase